MIGTPHLLRVAAFDRTLSSSARMNAVRAAFRLELAGPTAAGADVEPAMRVLRKVVSLHEGGQRSASSLLLDQLVAGGMPFADSWKEN